MMIVIFVGLVHCGFVDRLRRFEAIWLKLSEEQCGDSGVQVALTRDSHLYSEETCNIGF